MATTSLHTRSESNRAKLTYYFGKTRCDGHGQMKDLLGGKGANLAEMTRIALPVPPGFTITSEVCDLYYKNGRKLPGRLMDEVRNSVNILETETDKRLGGAESPLLVSVRSGAAKSMPGMMNTILNLGLNDEVVVALTKATGDERFAYDAYRRLIDMFGDVVCGVDHELFESTFSKLKAKFNATTDAEMPLEGVRQLCDEYKSVFQKHVRKPFPQDPFTQLEMAIEAVFRSWMQPRAVKYRQVENITGLLGTAVNVQAMVFGNSGIESATGVAFTRNPATGENTLYGEFLVNAQGEDVVAGIRTPLHIDEMPTWNSEIHGQLLAIKELLERHFRDMQDIEFTIEHGRLYMLQTRNGKRTCAAAVKIACDIVKEGLIDEKTAVMRVPAGDLTQLLLPSFDPAAKRNAIVLTRGLPASPGAAVGKLAFTAAEAVERACAGEQVLLVRKETNPDDIDGMHSAVGILTSTGGMTSHAAVVARGWGRCCVVGAGELHVDDLRRRVSVNGQAYSHEDVISIDGSTGEIMVGAIATQLPHLSGDFAKLMSWADRHRKLRVRANADTPSDADRARDFGAEGVGLCRTEHMFFEGDRINVMRAMILADNALARKAALKKLLPLQRKDFIGLFKAMKGWPVTIRLLDPPLHEFLPHDATSQNVMAEELGISLSELRRRLDRLREMNPMLGHRGCRLAVTYPEILETQVSAIVEAAIHCRKKGIDAQPEIMIPLVGTAKELEVLGQRARATIDAVKKNKKYDSELNIPIGTMIEVPRAAVTADEIASSADFISFGTNDLTQMTFGFSRDDVNTFLPEYLRQEILLCDPFQSLDTRGVGQLVEMAVNKGRLAKPKLKCGVCGEHGGDPDSIRFFDQAGVNYISCSPFRVPVARLAAAQAALANAT